MTKINIAIDGPSAAGKGTVADFVAREMGYIHLDTGAMYRCAALRCLRRNVPLKEEPRVLQALEGMTFEQKEDGSIWMDGEDVSGQIREDRVSLGASDVSTLKGVRLDMVRRQRQLARKKGYVLEGRDIGTVVLPDAELKIFLTASVEVRSRRRFRQNLESGRKADLETIRRELEQRDYQDSHRRESPLRRADDAIPIDTSDMTIEEVVGKVVSLARKKAGIAE